MCVCMCIAVMKAKKTPHLLSFTMDGVILPILVSIYCFFSQFFAFLISCRLNCYLIDSLNSKKILLENNNKKVPFELTGFKWCEVELEISTAFACRLYRLFRWISTNVLLPALGILCISLQSPATQMAINYSWVNIMEDVFHPKLLSNCFQKHKTKSMESDVIL